MPESHLGHRTRESYHQVADDILQERMSSSHGKGFSPEIREAACRLVYDMERAMSVGGALDPPPPPHSTFTQVYPIDPFGMPSNIFLEFGGDGFSRDFF